LVETSNQISVCRGETDAFLKKAWQKTLHKGLAENYKAKGVVKEEICFG